MTMKIDVSVILMMINDHVGGSDSDNNDVIEMYYYQTQTYDESLCVSPGTKWRRVEEEEEIEAYPRNIFEERLVDFVSVI